MFAWAKHAQPTEVPNDVGFSLQPDEYLVLQVCSKIYFSQVGFKMSTTAGALCKTSTKRSKRSGCDGETGQAKIHSRWISLWTPLEAPRLTLCLGMFLLLRSRLEIPPFTPAVHGDVNCQANLRWYCTRLLVGKLPPSISGPQSMCLHTAPMPIASDLSYLATGIWNFNYIFISVLIMSHNQ